MSASRLLSPMRRVSYVDPRGRRARVAGLLSVVLGGTYAIFAAGWPATTPGLSAAGQAALARTAQAAPISCSAETADRAAAVAVARHCGTEVRVADLTTAYDESWVQPDGSVRWEHRYRPVRVKRDGRWTAVDTTLAAGPDGAVRPAATATGLVFSGGGSGPMVTITEGDAVLRLGSPVGDLPAPALHGATATYSEVLPGVDLQLTADVDGYAQVLKVKHRAAAANPALNRLRFALDTDNLTVSADAAGNLRARNAAGKLTFSGNTPLMWDAKQRRTAAMGTSVAKAALAVTPDRAMLNDPATEFPVYIDPAVSAARSNWAKVDYKFPTTSYWNATGDAPVGTNNGGTNRFRSFFDLDVGATPIAGKHIMSANFVITETHSWSCVPKQVDLWATTYVGSATTWNNQPTFSALMSSKTVAAGYSTACPDQVLSFPVTPVVQSAANGSWVNVSLGLRSPNETDSTFYKTFSNNPTLQIRFSAYPPAAGCPGGVAKESDFNGDGAADVAIGDPEATVNGLARAGRVTVDYGTGGQPQEVRQGLDNVPGGPELGDQFGYALDSFDANQDGCADLLVGAPFEAIGTAPESGGAVILFGSPAGLTKGPGGIWLDQGVAGIGDDVEAGDWFGFAVTAGNLPSGDPFWAVGAPGEDHGSAADAGIVHYRQGVTDITMWGGSGVPGSAENDDRVGYSLASSAHHLAVGSPGESIGTTTWAGTVTLYTHAVSGTALTSAGVLGDGSGQTIDPIAKDDAFGKSLDMIPYDSSGVSVLAVGAPGNDVGTVADAGTVFTFLLVQGSWVRENKLVLAAPAAGDYLGEQVRLSGGGLPDLVAMGAPGRDVDGVLDAGVVAIGESTGLTGGAEEVFRGSGAQEVHGAYLSSSGANLYVGSPRDGRVVSYPWSGLQDGEPVAGATYTAGEGARAFGTAVS